VSLPINDHHLSLAEKQAAREKSAHTAWTIETGWRLVVYCLKKVSFMDQ
jgi:hypothetical protein